MVVTLVAVTPALQAIHQLEQAITLALNPSPSLGVLVRGLARTAVEELAAGVKLREMVASGARVPAGEWDEQGQVRGKPPECPRELFPRLLSGFGSAGEGGNKVK